MVLRLGDCRVESGGHSLLKSERLGKSYLCIERLSDEERWSL